MVGDIVMCRYRDRINYHFHQNAIVKKTWGQFMKSDQNYIIADSTLSDYRTTTDSKFDKYLASINKRMNQGRFRIKTDFLKKCISES